MMNLAIFIQVTIKSEIRKLVMVFGHVAKLIKEIVNHAVKINTLRLNGLMKKQKCIFMIGQ